jgi:succinate-semialdehyde dehydrogenase/glutarate-semialdehyde dehydrogenase
MMIEVGERPPDGVGNVVYGCGEVGEALVTDENVDGFGFVGSHGTAEEIVRAAGLTRSLIEASGNGPVIVCADADLEAAAKGPAFGDFFCAARSVARPSASSSTRRS